VGKVILSLRGLVKTYGGSRVLRGIDLDVQDGEFLTLLGPSGSGKTTLLRMVAGFVIPDQGRIHLDEQDVSYMHPGQRQLGMVFQNYALFPHLTAAENIGYGLKVRGWSRERRDQRVEEMLALVGLRDHARRFPRQLSGGQQQRVALARALAFGPRLLLMDEPLGALDRELRVRMAGELRRLHRDVGTTFLYVTHDRDEAMSLSDRVAIIRSGRIEAVGSPSELFASPPTTFVASFFGGHNVAPARMIEFRSGGVAMMSCGSHAFEVAARCTAPASDSVALVVPKAAIGLTGTGPNHVRMEAKVVETRYLGDVIEFTCATAELGTLIGTLNARLLDAPIRLGERVQVYIDASQCLAIASASQDGLERGPERPASSRRP